MAGILLSFSLLVLACQMPSLFAQPAFAQGGSPEPERREPGSMERRSNPALVPSPPPSNIDPGIQKHPEVMPDTRAVVPPPVVDPGMAVNPETAPPAREAVHPRNVRQGTPLVAASLILVGCAQ